MRRLLPVGVLALVLVFAIVLVMRDSGSSGTADGAPANTNDPYVPFDACGQGCGPPTPIPSTTP